MQQPPMADPFGAAFWTSKGSETRKIDVLIFEPPQ